MAEIDDLIKDIDDVLGNKEEPQTKEVEVKDETDALISEIESVLSPQQPAEEKPKEEIPQAVTPEKPKEELPKAVPSALPAPAPVKEPEVDLSKPSNIVLSVIGEKDEAEFTPADRDLIKSLDAADLNEFTKGRPDVFLDDDQKRQIFNYQRELRKSSPYSKLPTNWEEWYNLGAAASEDLVDVGVMTADLLGSALKGTAKAVKQGAPALLGMNSGYAEALAAEKLLPEDKKEEVENWRKRAWQIANTPVKGGEKQNPDAYTDAKYLAKIKEYLTPEQVAGIEKEFQEKRYQAKQVPFSYTSELASLPESVAFLGTKLGTGGMQLWDDASEKFGLTDEETSFERFKARSEVDTAQAKLIKSEPKSWARVVDTYYAPVMKSFSSLIHPSIDEYMIMYPDLSREEAQSKRQADIESGVLDTIEGIKKSIPENEPDIATFGSLTIPGQFGVDVFGYAYSVVQASKMLTPIAKLKLKKLGLDDDQINALETKAQGVAKKKELSKLEKLQKPGLVERAAGATARGIEKTGDYLERSPTWQTITKAAPAVTGATIGYQVNPENPFAGLGLGALGGVGAKYGVRTLVDIPKVIKEVQAARRISAGGSVGPLATLGAIAKQQDEVKTLTTKLKTLAEGTDEYVETKKALDVAKERVKGEGIVDYEGIGKVSDTTKRMLRFVNDDAIANIGEYARLGVEPTLIALATGVIDSSDEDELKTMIGQGLVFSLGGRAVQQSYHKFLGEDPVIAARRAKQANVDALKAYRDSTPETKGEIDKLTDWDLVIGRQAKKVADTEAEVQKLVNESPDAKKIEDAEKRLEAEKKSLSLLKTANVQTRNEFGRQFLNQLGRNNALLNGTLRAGQNNVGINILTTQQIFDHFRKNPQWQNVPDEVLMEYASQQGFYSGTGGTEFRPGVNVSDTARSMTFDPAKPSVVINSDALRNRIELFGETPIDALNHETGHAILRIKEIQDAVADASKLLFTNEITDASGNVKEITTGLYSEEQLNSLFKDQYLKNRSKDEIARLGAGLGLWDTNTNSLNKKKVANYMQEEILAELFSNTLSRNLGKNIDSKQVHLIDIARLKLKNKLFKNAVTKMLGLGMDGDVFSKATGATLTPDAQSASRNALRILQSINGDVTTIAEQPETAPISKADIRKSKIAAERYGMDSGLFATKVQAQVFDADGNPVGDAVDVTDPSVFEGSWRISKDGEERLSGYGQIPLELRQLQVPEGGTLSIKKKIITEVDGVTPQLLKPSDLRKIKKDRATLFKQAIDTPDYGTPGRFEPISEGSESYRGTFTPAQIKAIQELPEGIVPLKIKKYLLELNEAIVRRDGTRFFVDYAAVMDDNGNYKAFSPKIYDVVPIGLQLSTAGNFLVTTISVGRMMSKLNAWSDRMPNRLSPWNGSKEAFWNEFSTRYLDNWSKGIQGSGYNERGEAIGSNQLSDDVAVAEQKKSIFNDFLNLFKNETEVLNLDRTKIPKRKGDEKNKSIDRTIMSMRIDHMAELLDAQDLPKLPIDYGKALINFLPAEISVPTQEKLDELKSKLPNYQSIVKNIDDTQKHILVSDKNGFPAAFSEVSINKDNNSLKIDWVNTIIKKQGFAQALYREIAKYAQEQNLDTIEGDIVNDQARKRREELLKTISETQEPLGDGEYSTALVSKVPSDIRFMPAEVDARYIDLETKAKNFSNPDDFIKSQGQKLFHFSESKKPTFSKEGGRFSGNISTFEEKDLPRFSEGKRYLVELYLDGKILDAAGDTDLTPNNIINRGGDNVEFNEMIKTASKSVGVNKEPYLFPWDSNDWLGKTGETWRKTLQEELSKKGYVGYQPGAEIVITDPSAVKTKDQLVDIWNKSQKSVQLLPAEQGAEPEGLQGIELPTQYRRISDMIPPLRDIEPPVRAKAMLPDMELEPTIGEKPQSSPMIGVKKLKVSIDQPFDEFGDIDYDAEDAVRKIAKDRNLGITSDRELAFVAKDENGEIVGGAFTSADQDGYTFDVVVSKEAEGKGVGSKLLDEVINPPYEITEAYPDAKVKVDVVNPSMKKMLENRGFVVEEKIGKERWIMVPQEPTTSEKPIQSSDIITSAKPAPDAVIKPFSNALVSSVGLINFLPAYHGTPFEVDKFKLANIGTGEGAQAYGWGLYFAQAKRVAESYRDKLSELLKQPIDEAQLIMRQLQKRIDSGLEWEGPYNETEVPEFDMGLIDDSDAFKEYLSEISKTLPDDLKLKLNSLIKESFVDGNLYKVDLDVKDEDLLDWDKPLSEQSEKVKTALQSVSDNWLWQDAISGKGGEQVGGALYSTLRATFPDAEFSRDGVDASKKASEALLAAGIPGIRYLDGTSRKQGEGTNNYVIFDENLIKILDKNDKPVQDELPRATGLQFLPARPIGKNEPLPDFETTIIKGITPAKGFKWDKATNVEIDIGGGRKMTFSYDPEYLEVPKFKDLIKELKGQPVILLEADRQRATGGDMGGPLHPFLKSNQVTITGPDGKKYKAVWANMTSTFVSGAKNRLASHGAKYALVHLMDPIAHKSNKRTARTLDKMMRKSKLSQREKEIISLSMQAGIIAGEKSAMSSAITALKRQISSAKKDPEKIRIINEKINKITKEREDITPKGLYGEIFKAVSSIKKAISNVKTGNWAENSIEKANKKLEKYVNIKEYNELLKNNKSLYISDNIGNTFSDRGSAIGSILSFKFGKFDPSLVMRESSDFREGENLDIVTAVELSQNPDIFALYFGNDPKEEAAMSKAERKARDEMRANPDFVEHEAYDWVMLGPEKGNNFLVKNPVKPEQIFKKYRETHAGETVVDGSAETVAGAMRKNAGFILRVDEDTQKVLASKKKNK